MKHEIVLNGQAIALMSVGINNQLTKRQKGLLKLLHECLKKNKPLNWDLMVKFFIKNVDSTHRSYDWNRALQRYENSGFDFSAPILVDAKAASGELGV